MKTFCQIWLTFALALITLSSNAGTGTSPIRDPAVEAVNHSPPLYFEKNVGQLDIDADYVLDLKQHKIAFEKNRF